MLVHTLHTSDATLARQTQRVATDRVGVVHTRYRDYQAMTRAGATGSCGFCRMTGGGGVVCGGHQEIHNDTHNTASCYVIMFDSLAEC